VRCIHIDGNKLEVAVRFLQQIGLSDFISVALNTPLLWRCSLKCQFKPIAEEEVTRLQEFARSEGFTDKLQMWDVAYWRRRQKQHLHKYVT